MSDTTVTTPATELPVTAAELLKHCRQDEPDDASLLEQYARVAMEHLERHLRRTIMPATLTTYLRRFPGLRRGIRLPRPPFISITSVHYLDGAIESPLTWKELASAAYRVTNARSPAELIPAYGTDWPTDVLDTEEAVRIVHVGGFLNAAGVPESIRHAIKLCVGHWYEHREQVVMGGSPKELPRGVPELVAPWRLFETYEEQ